MGAICFFANIRFFSARMSYISYCFACSRSFLISQASSGDNRYVYPPLFFNMPPFFENPKLSKWFSSCYRCLKQQQIVKVVNHIFSCSYFNIFKRLGSWLMRETLRRTAAWLWCRPCVRYCSVRTWCSVQPRIFPDVQGWFWNFWCFLLWPSPP